MEKAESILPKISVIVPVYKTEQFLDECVGSILSQTLKELELILVDDGSPDRCPEICDKWAKKDDRVCVIHKENGGVQTAIYTGVKAARAEYVGFVDSDDWVGEKRFETLLNTIVEYNADCVQAGVSVIRFKTLVGVMEAETTKIFTAKEIEEQILEPFWEDTGKLTEHWGNIRSDKIFKKSILDTILPRIDLTLTMGEDLELNIQYLSECKKIVVLEHNCDYYGRQSRGTATSRFSEDMIAPIERYIRCLLKTAENQGREAKALNGLSDRLYADVILRTLASSGGSFSKKCAVTEEALRRIKNTRVFLTEFNKLNIVVRSCMKMIGKGCVKPTLFIGGNLIQAVRNVRDWIKDKRGVICQE